MLQEPGNPRQNNGTLNDQTSATVSTERRIQKPSRLGDILAELSYKRLFFPLNIFVTIASRIINRNVQNRK